MDAGSQALPALIAAPLFAEKNRSLASLTKLFPGNTPP